MATAKRFVRHEQTIQAFNEEVQVGNPATGALKQSLQNTWINEPIAPGQNPRTVKDALATLNRDEKLLQALGQFKTRKTDESTYSGKRLYKRVYVNADDITGPGPVNPFACQWRLASAKQELNGAGIRATDGDSQDRYLSSTALELFDYDDIGTHHTYPTFSEDFEYWKTSLDGGGWNNTMASHATQLRVRHGGRYLITGNLQLAMLTKSKSEFDYRDLDSIVEINEIDNPNKVVDINEIKGPKADLYYPYARIKMTQMSFNEVTEKYELKNVVYSGKVSMSPSGVSTRYFTAGFSTVLALENDDLLEFSLERSHRTMLVEVVDLPYLPTVSEAICAYKSTDDTDYLPNRDKSNYFELTRISGLS